MQDSDGKTALYHAVEAGVEDAIRLLLLKGAKLDIKDKASKSIQEVADEVRGTGRERERERERERSKRERERERRERERGERET